MAFINLSTTYMLKSGSGKALASTSHNDSLIAESPQSSNSQIWFFTDTGFEGFYRLHTLEKGNYSALDVYNYIGSQTIDLHFYATQSLTGQYWKLDKQNDGTFKISNNFTGPDMYLGLKDGTLEPMLAARDTTDYRWLLSAPGNSSSATVSGASTSNTASATNGPSTPSDAVATSSCTGKCLESNSPGGSKQLSAGAIGGIVGGSVFAGLLIAGVLLFLYRRRRSEVTKPSSGIIGRKGFLHG